MVEADVSCSNTCIAYIILPVNLPFLFLCCWKARLEKRQGTELRLLIITEKNIVSNCTYYCRYNLSGMHTQLRHNPNAFLEVVNTTEEGTNDELEDEELEELLTWSSNLSFEK